jgi:hypothetical protein
LIFNQRCIKCLRPVGASLFIACQGVGKILCNRY